MAPPVRRLSTLDVGELLGHLAVAYPQHIDSPDVSSLVIPAEHPPDDTTVANGEDLLRLEARAGCGLEEAPPEGSHRGGPLEALAVRRRQRVLEHAVCRHQRHHPVDVVAVEHVVEPTDDLERGPRLGVGHGDHLLGDCARSRTAWIMTMRCSSRFRCPARTIASRACPMTMRWTLWAGPEAPVLGPTASAVTSSQARTWNPAASITARISPGARRKLAAASRAHITGNTTGWTGPAIGSWSPSGAVSASPACTYDSVRSTTVTRQPNSAASVRAGPPRPPPTSRTRMPGRSSAKRASRWVAFIPPL